MADSEPQANSMIPDKSDVPARLSAVPSAAPTMGTAGAVATEGKKPDQPWLEVTASRHFAGLAARAEDQPGVHDVSGRQGIAAGRESRRATVDLRAHLQPLHGALGRQQERPHHLALQPVSDLEAGGLAGRRGEISRPRSAVRSAPRLHDRRCGRTTSRSNPAGDWFSSTRCFPAWRR